MNVQLLQGKERKNISVDARDFASYRTCATAAFEQHAGVSRAKGLRFGLNVPLIPNLFMQEANDLMRLRTGLAGPSLFVDAICDVFKSLK